MAESEWFERGLRRRREVLGSNYADAGLCDSGEFMMAFQRAVTEVAWGWAWSRPGLDAKTRSMISLAMARRSAASMSSGFTSRVRLAAE